MGTRGAFQFTGSGSPESRISVEFDSLKVPAGAAIRVHRLPKESVYSSTGTAGQTRTRSGSSRSPAREGCTFNTPTTVSA